MEKHSQQETNTIFSEQVGIWKFSKLKETKFEPRGRWEEVVSGVRLFRRLAMEISTISRTKFTLFVLSKVWEGVQSAIFMHISSRLLQILEVGLRDGDINLTAIYTAVTTRLLCGTFVATLGWWSSHYNPAFRTQVIQYYEVYLMRTRLRLDLSAAQDLEHHPYVSPTDAWDAFDAIVTYLGGLLTFVSQLLLAFNVSRSTGGPIFAVLCVSQPLLRVLFTENLWSKMWVVSLANDNYRRLDALASFTTDRYRQDYLTGNLGEHILNEYEQARKGLGDTPTDSYWEIVARKDSPLFEIACTVASELPMIYCAISAALNPSRFSIASIAVLQHSSATLQYSIQNIVSNTRSFQYYVTRLKNLYTFGEKKNKIADGKTSYPVATSSKAGMGLELKNVIFDYPGSKNKEPALRNVSLTVEPGQLVVIVGTNGSGKSTIVKLLTRLYHPTSGALLIDGIPAEEYRPSDLRHSTASFTQDHNLYPFSIYENIALGNLSCLTDTTAVAEAAKQGGAAEFIEKFVDGMDTSLNVWGTVSNGVPEDPEHPLRKEMENLSKTIDISGGEKQRLVAARTFLHLTSGAVKLVTVDEPSSALDAKAELQLFERLIACREGKTMVFVTHRFGHLTKHADIIVCMKNGNVVETGSHDELMILDGEYASLYQIQSDAFNPGST